MDGNAVSALSVVEPNDEMKQRKMELAYAVIVTNISPATPAPGIMDIDAAVINQFSCVLKPVAITRFHQDFVIYLTNTDEYNLLLSSEVLYGHGFNGQLMPWTSSHGSRTIYWHTEVAIDISGIPSHACPRSCLGPLLSRHCSIQSYRLNNREGTCHAIGYAYSVESIPTSDHVAFQYETSHGVANQTYPVTLQTYLLSEAPEFETDTGNLETARNALPPASPTDDLFQGGNSDCSDHGWESDRSWKLFR